MARFIALTGIKGEQYFFNIERISLEKVTNYLRPGHFASDGNQYTWTVVREQGQPDRLVKEPTEDIIKAIKK